MAAIGQIMKGFVCEAFGSTHQGNTSLFPMGSGKQCVAISGCALAWQSIGGNFNTETIDAILYAGDSLYCSLRSEQHQGIDRYLLTEEISQKIIRIQAEQIKIVEVNNIYNGLWPGTAVDVEESVRSLADAIDFHVSEELNVGYLFIGLLVCVSFWRKQGQFYLFDSHGTNEKREHDSNERKNLARIFRCNNSRSLARLLLKIAPLKGKYDDQYSIDYLKFEHLTENREQAIIEVISINENLSITEEPNDDSILSSSYISNADSFTSIANETKNKGGRPKKTKRGRPKYLETTREEQVTAAKKKYNAKNPEIQKKAVQKYQNSHPEILEESKKVYNLNNPDVQKKAEKKYKKANPEVQKDASKKHLEKNPEKNAEYQKRFIANNPDESKMRHVPLKIRRLIKDNGPISYWNESLLDQIESYKLKKLSLSDRDIYKCPYCTARLYDEEMDRKKWCCNLGANNVLNLAPLTASFYLDREFLNRSRAYNDMFAFCATEISGGYRHPSGLSFFKIEGRMYHQVYNLNAAGQKFTTRENIAQFVNRSRLFIDDGEERRHLAEGRSLKRNVIDKIHEYLNATNPLIPYFKILGQQQSIHAHLEFEITNRLTHGPRLGDPNTGVEIHAILSTEETVSDPRRLSIWKVGNERPTSMSVFSPLMEPFQYPLFYPQGTPGWHIGRLDNRGQKLSTLLYSRCLLLSEPRFYELGRLSEAWQVDMLARKEEEILQYHVRAQLNNNNDNVLRVGPLDELEGRQVIADIANDETIQGEGGVQPGKIYLPSTFTGGPRYMKVHYENAMGLVSRKGRPTFFVTFTYSAQWAEHKASCIKGRINPSIACRIFHIKLLELMRDLRNGVFFGATAYIVHVIEMQMRGLPHAHIVLKIGGEGPIQATDIDSVIWATIPSEDIANGRLRSLVLQHMIHGPCGTNYRTDFVCWNSEKGYCTKFYPKPNEQTTHTDERGFVQYKRNYNNKGEIKCRNRTIEVHDGWVVPYNPALLLKYEAHINVELASTRRVIKYLFKYLMKGGSLQNVTITPLGKQENEINEYVTKRMLGASDACWRLFAFDLSRSVPTVECLPIHLKGKQHTIFRPGNLTEAIQRSTSKLLIYFKRPADCIFNELTYQAFYENCIIHTKIPPNSKVTVYNHPDGIHFITFRQRNEKVCRILWVSPNRGELYYLRLLLMTIPCRGYDDLLNKRTPKCVTFQELARHLGLVNDDLEYHQALREASVFMVGPRLRSFFVLLCNMGAPAALLWNDFRDALCEDHLERHPYDPELAYKLSLLDIDRCLRKQGSCLTEQGLPYVEDNTTELGRELLAYGENMQKTIVAEWLPKLSPDQRIVFDHVRSLIAENADQSLSKVIFLDGPGGYGKTQLIKTILADIRSRHQIAIAVASSGIAAVNIPGASTAHSMFRLPLDLGQGTGVWNITNRSQRAELIRAAQLIVFDEAPMAHRYIFEMIDRSLRDLMNSVEPFGGKIFICCGDFRQIAPVVQKARTVHDVVCISLRASRLWKFFKIFRLTTPQRCTENSAYLDFLLKIGNGTMPTKVFDEGRASEKLVPLLVGVNIVTSLEELVERVYPSHVLRDSDLAAKRAILAPLNENVKQINGDILNSIEGRFHDLYSTDSVVKEDDDGLDVDIQILNQAIGKGVPDHILRLKIGSVCLIMRNLNIADGLVNGTKVIITAISRRLITVRKVGERQLYGIPRIIFKFNIIEGSPLIISRRQFPIMLAYSMTGHKSQGQTLDRVGIDLRTDCFTHGQLYVLLSRVRKPEDITILVPSCRIDKKIAHVKNIVYEGLLL